MSNSIDGALITLKNVLNSISDVTCTLEKKEAGGKGVFIQVRPGEIETVQGYGLDTLNHSFDLIIDFKTKMTRTDKIAAKMQEIKNKILENRKLGGNANSTTFSSSSPEDDAGRDKTSIILPIVITTKELSC